MTPVSVGERERERERAGKRGTALFISCAPPFSLKVVLLIFYSVCTSHTTNTVVNVSSVKVALR